MCGAIPSRSCMTVEAARRRSCNTQAGIGSATSATLRAAAIRLSSVRFADDQATNPARPRPKFARWAGGQNGERGGGERNRVWLAALSARGRQPDLGCFDVYLAPQQVADLGSARGGEHQQANNIAVLAGALQRLPD